MEVNLSINKNAIFTAFWLVQNEAVPVTECLLLICTSYTDHTLYTE